MIKRDLESLEPDFRPVAEEAWALIQYHRLPFRIFETRRSKKRQQKLVERGVSKTMHGRHLVGEAIDFVYWDQVNKWSWDNKFLPWYRVLREILLLRLGDKLEICAEWDYPHYQKKR